MRTFGFVQILLLLIFLLAYQCTNAQDYLVTTRGDTLEGSIKLFNFGPEKKVQLVAEGRKKQSFPMTQVRSVVVDGEILQPQKGPDGYAFMKLVKDGFLSLYAFQRENQVSYDGLMLSKKDGTTLEVPNLNFKKALKRFLGDCDEVSDKLEDGDYTKKDLEMIIDEYNACLERKSSDVPVPARVTPAPAEPEAPAATNNTTAFAELEKELRSHPDFDGKQDAIDMVAEIRKKLSRGEKVPNFMTEGLKSALKDTSLNDTLTEALEEIR